MIGGARIIRQTADWIPDGAVNTVNWSVHVFLGFVLAGALAWRIVWRGTSGSLLPAADAGALHAFAKTTHYMLYALLLTFVILGIGNAFELGYNLFDVVHLPQVGDRAWRRQITQWHGLAANLLLGLALFHAAAALLHHSQWKDGVLGRMLPTRSGDVKGR